MLAAVVISFALENSNKPEAVKIAEYKANQEQVKLEEQKNEERKKLEEINNSRFNEITEREEFSYFDVFDLPDNEKEIVLSELTKKDLIFY